MSDYSSHHEVQPGQRTPLTSGVVFLWIAMILALLLFVPFAFETFTGILQEVG